MIYILPDEFYLYFRPNGEDSFCQQAKSLGVRSSGFSHTFRCRHPNETFGIEKRMPVDLQPGYLLASPGLWLVQKDLGLGWRRQGATLLGASTRLRYFCARQAFIPSQRDNRVRFLATNSYVRISNNKRGVSTYSSTTSRFQGT